MQISRKYVFPLLDPDAQSYYVPAVVHAKRSQGGIREGQGGGP